MAVISQGSGYIELQHFVFMSLLKNGVVGILAVKIKALLPLLLASNLPIMQIMFSNNECWVEVRILKQLYFVSSSLWYNS